ncbi:hypothetical protein [Microbacterium sp. LWS13-1.2]|uniref:DUF5519 family protein n=1 Tax=Microbacterium sp. LWS13-1.2 TaxID=3135264 RepID=A0AAU6SB72_9MICO
MRRWMLGAAATLAVIVWSVSDYMRWRALGVGGLPPTMWGWLRVTHMRIRAGDPFSVRTDGVAHPEIAALPARSSPRPAIAPHPVPHRVLDQHASADLVLDLEGVFDDFIATADSSIEYRTSSWERHNKALFLTASPRWREGARLEFGHFHPSDGSMHVILSPADAAIVVERSWGELHPLAGKMLDLPATYTLLYPPRDRDDLTVVRTILQAALVATAERSAVA